MEFLTGIHINGPTSIWVPYIVKRRVKGMPKGAEQKNHGLMRNITRPGRPKAEFKIHHSTRPPRLKADYVCTAAV
jgi:hypothetical protein